MDINEYFDKIFVINLDKDKDRFEKISNHLKEIGIWNFERVSGISIDNLPDVWQYRNFIKNDSKYIIGGLGCRYSHIEAVRLAHVNNYERVLILEDDAVFLKPPNELLEININILNDWDMLYFGGLIETEFRNQIVCAHAYGIRRPIYLDILNMANSSGMEIDNFYAKILHHMSYNYNQCGKWRIRKITPFNQVIQDKTFESNIQKNN
jgi:GR25 family glycosyltransferase involved in LPS biosynthesis